MVHKILSSLRDQEIQGVSGLRGIFRFATGLSRDGMRKKFREQLLKEPKCGYCRATSVNDAKNKKTTAPLGGGEMYTCGMPRKVNAQHVREMAETKEQAGRRVGILA
jgi:hypothetical protein